jgi:nucleotidyltransferase/DNA polymerase involved in DNA repair
MPMSQAVKLCPKLIIVKSHYRQYSSISKKVMNQVHALTPLVEQISIDETFFDVSDLPESGEQIAKELQSSTMRAYGLPSSIGVATNKLVAKIANDFGKASYTGDFPPNAITVVPAGQESDFLAPLPVDALWGIGAKTSGRLNDIGIKTIGDLANIPETKLVDIFGKHGSKLALRAKGIDNRPISTSREIKSISHERTFADDISDILTLKRTLMSLSENVGQRLRRSNKYGRTVKLKLRWTDFTTLSRQSSLDIPTNQNQIIYNTIIDLFNTVWIEGKSVRLLGVGVSGFETPVRQLSFWEDPNLISEQKDKQLQDALDALRDRFGDRIVQRASSLGRKDIFNSSRLYNNAD